MNEQVTWIACRDCGRNVLGVVPSGAGDGDGVSVSAELVCAGDRRHTVTVSIVEITSVDVVVPPSPALVDAAARRAELN